jgi:Chaperone for flagella basal body P-ring formation
MIGTATTGENLQVPERIMVRRAGGRMSCAEITQVLSHALRSGVADPKVADTKFVDTDGTDRSGPVSENLLTTQTLDCTSALHIPHGSPLKLMRQFWDPALHNWEYSLRCVHPSDCVPFLIRSRAMVAQGPKTVSHVVPQMRSRKSTARDAVSDAAVQPLLRSSHSFQESPRLAGKLVNQPLLVRPGETVTLIWEEAGIRLVLPVTCLDRGGLGQAVRARMKTGGRVLRAEVVGEGKLRAAL